MYDDYSILAMIRQGLGVSVLYRLVLAGFGEGLAVRPVEEPLERTVALAWRQWETLPLAAGASRSLCSGGRPRCWPSCPGREFRRPAPKG